MSRIGKQPIQLPQGVEFIISDTNVVTIKGKKGELQVPVDQEITFTQTESSLLVERPSDSIKHKSLHGLYRSLIANAVQGVTEGFTKTLEIVGVGYRASMNDNVLELTLGYSHPFFFVPPDGILLDVDTKTSKTPRILISGIDKELVGQVAAKIRSLRPPEPYKGKGVKYLGEIVRRKAGKSAGK